MTITAAPPPSIPAVQPSRARRVGVDLIHGGVVLTCALAVVFRLYEYSDVARIWNAVEIRFAVLVVLIFGTAFAASDQAKSYRRRLALLDAIEVGLMLHCFYLLGLVPATPRTGVVAPGWTVFFLGIAVFLQMLWRKWAYLDNHSDHWDFRFLVIATAGGASAASGWLQIVFLVVSAALVGLYVQLRLNVRADD